MLRPSQHRDLAKRHRTESRASEAKSGDVPATFSDKGANKNHVQLLLTFCPGTLRAAVLEHKVRQFFRYPASDEKPAMNSSWLK